MAIETVGVIGCGLMGSGITQVCAQAGYRTIVREATGDLVSGGIGRIDGILSRNVSKGRMTRTKKRPCSDASRARRISRISRRATW